MLVVVGLGILALGLALAVPLLAKSRSTTRYVSTSGSDAGSCTSADKPCRSLDYAYDQARARDVVKVAAGSYGSQRVSGMKSRPGVLFRLARGAHLRRLNVEATWVEFRGGRIDGYGWWTEARDPVPSNVRFRNVRAKSVAMNGGRNISVIGGSIGAYTAPAGKSAAVLLYGEVAELSNVRFDGVTFHDITHADPDDHFEAIRIDNGAHDIAIRRSRFRNITANTSIIFLTNTYFEPGDPYNFKLENNFFDEPRRGPGGDAFYVFNMHDGVQTCRNFAFRYNSFASPPAILACASKSNVSWIGNVGPKGSECEGNVFSHNVWLSRHRSARCSSTDTWVPGDESSAAGLRYVNPSAGDLHLRADSPAKDAGDLNVHPPTDIDCGKRRSGTAPDAGADEYGQRRETCKRG
ncbi:MAG: hypothetical protein ACRDKY_02075 [Solirubrobacteraceae bacterium]